jgi:hypothetical protein
MARIEGRVVGKWEWCHFMLNPASLYAQRMSLNAPRKSLYDRTHTTKNKVPGRAQGTLLLNERSFSIMFASFKGWKY